MATDAVKLEEAKAALHKLNIGESARVFVDQNGERVEFTSINRAQLEAYIQTLEGRVNSVPSGPLQVWM